MPSADKPKLLVVDDEAFNRDLLARRLERAGFAVHTAASAPEALAEIEKGVCELVLLDNMMPGMSGLDLLQLLRATRTPSDLPVIMVTALNESERVVEALNLGANDYVTKPIDFPVALARIHAQLHRKEAERALRVSEERFALAARGSNDGLWDWDLRTGTIFFSARWKEMLGYLDGELKSTEGEWFGRVHAEDAGQLTDALNTARSDQGPNEFINEHRVRHRDGTYRWMLSRGMVQRDAAGRAVRMAGSVTDVTRNKAFDALTGLPNRVLFHETLGRRLAEYRAGETSSLFLLFLDLDRFKIVNDSLGHQAGDTLLVEVARRLRQSLRLRPGRDQDLVARLGGDEFALLLSGGLGAAEAEQVAQRILLSVRQPVRLEGREVFPSVSIGLAEGNLCYQEANELLRDADTAMYRAKAAGKGRVTRFEPSMREEAVERLELEADLKHALDKDEFRLFYQPKMNLASGLLVGFEALIRWQHPKRGLMAPDYFIPIAEETGLIVPIGNWVLEKACETVKVWQDQFPLEPPLEISVNLSVRQFREPGLVEQVRRAIEKSGIDPGSLQLEVTESVLIRDFGDAGETFAGLKALGVGLKIDDFGTGYSSLQYLARLPFDSLKIDRSFVFRMCDDTQSLDVVRTIVDLARNLGMQVVAEGVETEEQVEQLRSLGCGFGQGFYFSRPVPIEEAAAFLRSSRELPPLATRTPDAA